MKARFIAIGAALVIAALWVFPRFWYTEAAGDRFVWLRANTNVAGWKFEPQEVEKSAEAILVADRLYAGEFRRGMDVLRVFGADRFTARQNEIGLFTHTPDRCWVQAGWKIEAAAPDAVEIEVDGTKISVERRIFSNKGHRELVYFWGMSSGRPLPFRLDHNLSVGSKQALSESSDTRAGASRAVDRRFWGRVWDSFRSRKSMSGPKQFFRVSTPVTGGNGEREEKALAGFLGEWLQPAEFESERKLVSSAR